MASKGEIRKVVSQEINKQIKRFKNIMGPNTKKLLNATDKRGFEAAFKKKNWSGTTPVHAAAIVSIGAVVVPDDKEVIEKNISTLKAASTYTSVETLIKTFATDTRTLRELIQTYDTKDKRKFFDTIQKINQKVSDHISAGSGSESEQTSGEQKSDNPTTTDLPTMLANITTACKNAVDNQTTDVGTLFKNIRQYGGIGTDGQLDNNNAQNTFQRYLDHFLKNHETQLNQDRLPDLSHLKLLATQDKKDKTAKSLINKIFDTIQKTVEQIYQLREQTMPKITPN